DLEYSAGQLSLAMNESSQIEKILGRQNARLVTTNDFGVTTTHSEQVDLEFDASDGESLLKRALATGKTVVESKPTARPGRLQPETRILRSDVVEMKMRPGGEQLESIDTPGRGTLEFLPNRAGQHKRRVEGDKFHVAYGADNQIESFHTGQATTRTEN